MSVTTVNKSSKIEKMNYYGKIKKRKKNIMKEIKTKKENMYKVVIEIFLKMKMKWKEFIDEVVI